MKAVYLRGDQVRADEWFACMGHIEAGVVAVIHSDSRGHEAIVDIRGAGAILAEESLLERCAPSPNRRLEALVPTRVHWITPTSSSQTARAGVTRAVMSVVATRIRQQHEYACRKRLQCMSQKVADTLLLLSRQTVHGSDDPALHYLGRSDIARIVGANRSGVSNVTSDFVRRGWCSIIDKTVTNLHERALSAHATKGLQELDPHLRMRLSHYEAALVSLLVPASTSGPCGPEAA